VTEFRSMYKELKNIESRFKESKLIIKKFMNAWVDYTYAVQACRPQESITALRGKVKVEVINARLWLKTDNAQKE